RSAPPISARSAAWRAPRRPNSAPPPKAISRWRSGSSWQGPWASRGGSMRARRAWPMARWRWPPFWADSSPSSPAASRLENFNDPRGGHGSVAEILSVLRPAPASFRLDPGGCDHLSPFRVVVADDLGIGRRGGADHLDADRGNALAEAGRGDRLRDRAVERVDDVGRCSGRRHQADA